MKKNIKMLVINVSALALMLSSSIMCFADVGEKSIYIDTNQIWSADYENTDSRTGSYSTVYARNHAVRPISGIDTFSTIQCQVTNGYDYVISDVIPLKESNSSNTSISIKEGYLSCKFVGFEFRGNSSAAAYATVSYDGR